VGNTPSTLALPPGAHDIVVKKSGYKDWRRVINMTSGSIRLNAELVVSP
jgi:hypothetical protein